jgi:threonine dehydrogenase-like Zn-dependent dehydrogenase
VKSRVMLQVGDRRIEEDELEVPVTKPDTALLRVEACGLCGSDVEQYRGHFAQKGMIQYPVVPGHEPVGIIDEIGSEAAQSWHVSRGDRVAIVPSISCGRCGNCLDGNNQLCRELFRGSSFPSYGYISRDLDHGLWGGYSEYIALHPNTLLYKVPDHIPPRTATLYQALASGLRWAVQVPRTTYGDSVLVLGAGQRGLAAVLALRACGAGDIIVTGIARDAYKLEIARQLGATHTIVADQEDTVSRVMEITGGRGVDVALDVVPALGQTVVDAFDCVRTGGTVVLAGLKGSDIRVNVDTDRLVNRDITVHGVFSQPAAAYRDGVELLASKLDEVSVLHTHEYPLADVVTALEVLGGEDPGEQPISVSIYPTA